MYLYLFVLSNPFNFSVLIINTSSITRPLKKLLKKSNGVYFGIVVRRDIPTVLKNF